MKRMAQIVFLSFLVLALLTLSGLSRPAMGEKNVLKIGVGIDVTGLDPHNYRATTDLLVTKLICETLVEFDLNMKVVPGLATSWERLDDTTWRFKLRKGVKFHDGTPFDAKAAKISLDRAKDAPRAQNYVGFVASTAIEDDYTIVVKSKRPFANFLGNLCSPVGGFISPKAIETYKDDIASHPVGTGRFKLKEWRPKERLVLVRNDNYWGKKVKLNECIIIPIPEEGTRAMAFESVEIDVIMDPLPHRIGEYKANKNINVITGPASRMVWVGFNPQDKVLSNINLRRAIAHAINRDEIVEHVMEGLGINAQEIIPPIIMKSKKKYNFNYDPERAKKLLIEAGYPNGLELNLWTPEGRYLKDRQIAEAVQAQLARIGIKVKIQVMEWGAYVDAVFRHEQQLYIVGWGFGAGDPDAALRACFYSTSKFNWSNYRNPEMDRLLDRAISTLDPKQRENLYNEIQQLLIDDVALVPIYHKLNIYATNKRVKKFYPHPMELIDISETAVE